MSNTMLTTVYNPVKVTDKDLQRNGQVGVYLGPGDVDGESVIKFEDDKPGHHDTFKNSSLAVL
jgi:hypothetical protein